MNNFAILNLQTLMAVGVFVVIFRIYLRPWFAAQPFAQAVLPLLLLNAFRYMGLSAIVPGQIDTSISMQALQIIGWCDFASGVCALLAAVAIHHRWSTAIPLIVLFLIVGIGDFITVGITGSRAGVFDTSMGTLWFISVLYAPAILLSQGYIAYRLILHLTRPRAQKSTDL